MKKIIVLLPLILLCWQTLESQITSIKVEQLAGTRIALDYQYGIDKPITARVGVGYDFRENKPYPEIGVLYYIHEYQVPMYFEYSVDFIDEIRHKASLGVNYFYGDFKLTIADNHLGFSFCYSFSRHWKEYYKLK